MNRAAIHNLRIHAGIIAALLGFLSAAQANLDDLRVGASEQDAYRIMGEPQGKMRSKNGTILIYDQAGIELHQGRVFRIDPSLGLKAMKRGKPAKKEGDGGFLDSLYAWSDAAKEKLSGLFGAKPKAKAAVVVTAPATPQHSAVKSVSDAGRPIEVSRLVVPSSVTIIDFCADWSSTCRRINPKLELLAKQDEGVYLRKVDIVRWGTEVTQQYNISEVPHVCVYDRKGEMVGGPTSDFDEVQELVALAKQS